MISTSSSNKAKVLLSFDPLFFAVLSSWSSLWVYLIVYAFCHFISRVESLFFFVSRGKYGGLDFSCVSLKRKTSRRIHTITRLFAKVWFLVLI